MDKEGNKLLKEWLYAYYQSELGKRAKKPLATREAIMRATKPGPKPKDSTSATDQSVSEMETSQDESTETTGDTGAPATLANTGKNDTTTNPEDMADHGQDAETHNSQALELND